MTQRRSFSVALIALLFGLFGRGPTPQALAQSLADLQEAKQAFRQGQQLYEKGDFGGALEQFSRGHQLSGKGGFLFNMAECARQLDSRQAARDLYLRYVRENPQGKHRPEALRQCRSLAVGPCPADGVVPQEPAPATASAPDPVEALPPAEAAPAPTIATQPDYLPPGADPPGAKQEQSRPFYKHWGFWAGVGAVVVGGAVTAVVLATRSDDRPSYPSSDFTVDFTK